MSARRRMFVLTAAVVLLVLLVVMPVAQADVFSNVAPASQLPSGALADAYPLGSYLLDHHFDAVKAGVLSGVDVSGIPPTIAWFLAQLFWQLTAFLANAVITLFTFAFSLDLVNGSAATGGAGALEPVSDAVRTIYRDVFGEAWLTVAVLLAGMWAIWNALVRRRYTETAGALATSVVFVVIALAFVTQPERTIGTASRWTNQMSGAFLSLSSNGTVTDHDDAKREVGDQLFKTLIYDPWVVLNFGGLEHCVRNAGSDNPTSVPVRPLSRNPSRDAQLSRQLAQGQQIEADGKVCVNNAAKYAPHFLRFAFHSDQRDAEYEALKAGDSGKLPDEDPGKRDGTYRLSPVDKPAAEAMGKDGQYDRLGLAIVIFAGELGAFMLLGSLSIMVIVAQVLVLLLLAFAPIALVVGVFPRRGHEFFISWLQRIAGFLLRKAVYSLVLAVLLAVAAALADATGNLGWLMAFGLQAALYWTVFLTRRQLAGQLTGAITGNPGTRDQTHVGGLLALYAAGRVTRRALRAGRTAITHLRQPPVPPAPAPLEPPRPQQPEAPAAPAGGGSAATDGDGEPSAVRDADPAPHRQAASADAPQRTDTSRHAPAAPRLQSVLAPSPASDSRAPEPARTPRPQARASAAQPPGLDDQRDVAAPTHRPQPQSAPARGRADDRDAPRDSTSASTERPAHTVKPAQRTSTAPNRPGADAASSSTTDRGRGSDSPLLSSLRRDAQRLHHDAARLHHDAEQLGDRRDDQPTRASTQHQQPTPPPARRVSPRETSDGGDGQ